MTWNCRRCHRIFDNSANLMLHSMNRNCLGCYCCDYIGPTSRQNLQEGTVVHHSCVSSHGSSSTPMAIGQFTTPIPMARMSSVTRGTPSFAVIESSDIITRAPVTTRPSASTTVTGTSTFENESSGIVTSGTSTTSPTEPATDDEKTAGSHIHTETTSTPNFRGKQRHHLYRGPVNDACLHSSDRLTGLVTKIREQTRPLTSVLSSKKLYFAARIVERATLTNGTVYELTSTWVPEPRPPRVCRNVGVQTESRPRQYSRFPIK